MALVDTVDTILPEECLKLLTRVLVLFATDAPRLSALVTLLLIEEKLARSSGTSIGESGGGMMTLSAGERLRLVWMGEGMFLGLWLSYLTEDTHVGVD